MIVNQDPMVHMEVVLLGVSVGSGKEMGNNTENVCCQKVKCITNYEDFSSLCVSTTWSSL